MGSAVLIGLSAAAAIGGGIMQYNAARNHADAAEATANAQARIQEQNSQRARDEAEATTKAGAQEEDKLRDRLRAIQGAQAAGYGASNLSLASGSPLAVSADTAVQGDEDIATYDQNTARRKFALVNQAQDYELNARLTRQSGQNQASALRSSGNAALAGSVFSAAGTVANKWTNMFGSSGSAAGASSGLKYAGDTYSNDWTMRDYMKNNWKRY